MADIRPEGIDQTTGQQRQVEDGDSVVGNIGNEISLGISQGTDYSGDSPRVVAQFPWTNGSALSTPASAPGSNGAACQFSPNGEFLAVGQTSADPRLFIYQRTGTTFNYLDTQPDTQPTVGVTNDVDWTQNGEFLAVSNGQSVAGATFSVYQRDGAAFTKISDPATHPRSFNSSAGTAGVAWSKNGEYLAVGFNVSPYLLFYERNGTTLTLLDAPASTPYNGFVITSHTVDWSPDGKFFAYTYGETSGQDGLFIYENDGTGPGNFTLLSEPSTIDGDAVCVKFSPNGEFLAVGTQGVTSTSLNIYQISGSTFTRVPNPDGVLPFASPRGFSWSQDSQYLVAGSERVRVYQRNGTTFTFVPSSDYNNSGNEFGVSLSSDGQFLAMAHGGSPNITIRQTGSSQPSSGVVVARGIKRAGT